MTKPGSVAVVVLTALNLEFEQVREHLLNQQEINENGTVFVVGQLPDGASVALGITGEGNEQAAAIATQAVTRFRPAALLFAGVAGSLADLRLGDIVVATKIYAYQGGTDDDMGFHARPEASRPAHALVQLARHVANTSSWIRLLPPDERRQPPEVHFKPIASGNVVMNTLKSALRDWIRQTFSDALAVDMESAGAAHAGHVSGIPVLTIRGISDQADGMKAQDDKRGSQPIAARHAAAFVITLVAEIAQRAKFSIELAPKTSWPSDLVSRLRLRIHARGGLVALAVVVTAAIVSAATAIVVTKALSSSWTSPGGLDLQSYCTTTDQYHYSKAKMDPTDGSVSCDSKTDLTSACNWTWAPHHGLTIKFPLDENPLDRDYPNHGQCYDAAGKNHGGIGNMTGYCVYQYGAGSAASIESDNVWHCTVKVDTKLACIVTYHDAKEIAKYEDRKWNCYGES